MRRKGIRDREDLLLDPFPMRNEFVDVVKAFAEFDSLFGRDSAVNGVLNHIKGCFAAFVNERRNIEFFAGMGKGHFAGFLKHIENWNPILAGRFHADVHTVVFMEPFSQLSQVLGEG